MKNTMEETMENTKENTMENTIVNTMEEKCRNMFVISFHCLCWMATTTVILYWVYLFSLNEDLSNVDNKLFYETKHDVFPVLSLCFKNPFSEGKLKMTGTGINATSYLKFLNGEYFSSEMKDIDYENITMDISEYLKEIYVLWRNGSRTTSMKSPSLFNKNQSFVSTFSGIWFQEMFYKCYGMEIPHAKYIQAFNLLLSNKLFQRHKNEFFHFFTLLHYPNQLLRAMGSIGVGLPHPEPNTSLDMSFFINAAEVIKRRNKSRRPCNEEWKNHDAIVLSSHTNEVGCRAPYQYPSKMIRTCSTQHEMQRARFALRADEYGTSPPCVSMDKII
jgi:hypothetical protein